jgi:glycosyltransferase involved in cell wall biosynthesis
VLDEELPFLYSMAEVFVFPSFYEGFGLPPLEAMSCGCPTIVSKAASLPEVCGEASLYFDPHRVDEMALAIERVVLDRDLRRELVRKGYERVQLFDWKKSAERHEQIFNKRG